MSINELMVLMKAIRERVNQLRTLRNQVSTREYTYFGSDKKTDTEPQYDVKAVDKKVTQLELFLFKADAKIKQSNAVTKIEIDADVDSLLSPLE